MAARLFAVACLVLALACGGGSSSPKPPVLSNFQLNPASIPQTPDPGGAPVQFTCDFEDESGNLETFKLTTGGLGVANVAATTSGGTRGSISGSFLCDTRTAGAYTCDIQVSTRDGAVSNTLSARLAITPPAPLISYLNPGSVEAGTGAFTLTLYGSQFTSFSQVLWNGTPVPTTVLGDSVITARIPAEATAVETTAKVAVQNLDVTGRSSDQTFPVTRHRTVLGGIPTYDLAWDPLHDKLYASTRISVNGSGCSIGTFDPVSGDLLDLTPVADIPSRLAISADAQYLYVALDSGSVQRFKLPGMTPDLAIPLAPGALPGLASTTILDLQVAPGQPTSFAVAFAPPQGFGAQPSVAVIDGSALRGSMVLAPFSHAFSALAWNTDGTQLYGANFLTTAFDLGVMAVDPGGIALTVEYPYVFQDSVPRISWDPVARLVYSDSGQAVDPVTGLVAGSFNLAHQANGGSQGVLALDRSAGRAFFLVLDRLTTTYHLQVFDLGSYASLDLQPVPLHLDTYAAPSRMVRTSHGLAIGGGGACLALVSGRLVQAP